MNFCENYIKIKNNVITRNGLVFVLSDNSIRISGESTSLTTLLLIKEGTLIFEPGIRYTVGGCSVSDRDDCWITVFDTKNRKVLASDRGFGDSFICEERADYIRIYLRVREGADLQDVMVNPFLSKIEGNLEKTTGDSQNNLSLTHVCDKINDLYEKFDSIEHSIADIKIRMHDVQDQVYNVKGLVNDVQIRTHDIQDQTYNQIAQNKATDEHYKLFFWSLYKKRNETLKMAKLRFFKDLPKATGILEIKQKIILIILKEIDRLCKLNHITYWLDCGTLLGAVRHEGFVPWDDDADLGIMRKDLQKLEKALSQSKVIDYTQCYTIRFNTINLIRIKLKTSICPIFVDVFIYDFCDDSSLETWHKFSLVRRKINADLRSLKNSDEEIKNNPSEDPIEKAKITDEQKLSKIKQTFAEARDELGNTIGLSEKDNKAVIWGYDNFATSRRYIWSWEDHFPVQYVKFEGYDFPIPNNYENKLLPYYGDYLELPSDILTHNHFKTDEELENNIRKAYNQFKQYL